MQTSSFGFKLDFWLWSFRVGTGLKVRTQARLIKITSSDRELMFPGIAIWLICLKMVLLERWVLHIFPFADP